MDRKLSRSLLALSLSFLLFLPSCNNEIPIKKEPQVFTGIAMTIPYRILVDIPPLEKERTKITRIFTEAFAEVDEVFNKWNPQSELSKLNTLKAGEKVKLSPHLDNVLKKIQPIVQITNGKFDPTIETVQALWKPYLQEGTEPPEQKIALIKGAAGWHHIHLEDGYYSKDNDLTAITLEGVMRGLSVDVVYESLAKAGLSNFFVEWGGEVRTKGHHPSGRPWNVTLNHITDGDLNKPVAFVSLSNQSLATTGGSIMQSWEVGNVKYRPIFDVLECRPIKMTDQAVVIASVVASSCFLADALTKAALTFPDLDSAQKWADSITKREPDIAIWLIAPQN